MINKVFLEGYVGKEPTVRTTSTGAKIVSLQLATTQKVKGQTVTQWHNIAIFGQSAETAEKYIHSGSLIAVDGSINYGKYTDNSGIERDTCEIICFTFYLIAGPKNQSATTPAVNSPINQHVSGATTPQQVAPQAVPQAMAAPRPVSQVSPQGVPADPRAQNMTVPPQVNMQPVMQTVPMQQMPVQQPIQQPVQQSIPQAAPQYQAQTAPIQQQVPQYQATPAFTPQGNDDLPF